MKYVVLIYSNAQSRELWQQFSETERGEGLAYYARFTAELEASGELVVSQALADPSTTKRVRVDEGRAMTTDGPFAEAKEQLAGYYVLDVESPERAVEIAQRDPASRLWAIEVRPIMESVGAEM